MRITVLALGTHGDVQPLIALAVGLQQSGRHQVRLAAPDDFGALAAAHGLEFCPLGLSARELLVTAGLQEGLERGRNVFLWVAQVMRTMRPLAGRLCTQTWLGCQGAERIVYSTMGLSAYHAAERLGVPCCWAIPFPAFARTRTNPGVLMPQLPLGASYNLLVQLLSEQLIQIFTRGMLNVWRREQLGLPAIPPGAWPYARLRGHPVPILFSYSPLVAPPPPDWGAHVHVTGYWQPPPSPGWGPPPGLLDFIAAGPPPVYVGFGSIAHRDPVRTTRIVSDALALAGQRGVLMAGWGGLSGAAGLDSTGRLFTVEAIPHSWLFPQLAAVVHHGGAGTTGAGLCAGVPSVLVPHAGDQPFWGRRVAALGVGPRPIPSRALTAERLAAAIDEAATSPGLRARAAGLGERLRAEGGIVRAIEVIERAGAG